MRGGHRRQSVIRWDDWLALKVLSEHGIWSVAEHQWPASQTVQLVALASFEYVPCAHVSHLSLPNVLVWVPAVQVPHASRLAPPGTGLAVPGGQSTQEALLDAPAVGLYLPGEQNWHAFALSALAAGLYVPAKHAYE